MYYSVVVQRNESTNIAYRVMKFKLSKDGFLEPKRRGSIHDVKVKFADEVDFDVPVEEDDSKCEYTYSLLDVMAAWEDEPVESDESWQKD